MYPYKLDLLSKPAMYKTEVLNIAGFQISELRPLFQDFKQPLSNMFLWKLLQSACDWEDFQSILDSSLDFGLKVNINHHNIISLIGRFL